MTTVAARAAEGARAAFRPAELPLKDDCRRRRDERDERRERRRERGQSNVRDVVACEKKKKQNTIGEVSSHDSRIFSSSVRRDRVIRSVARDRDECQPDEGKNASRRGRLAIIGKKPSVRGVTRVSADGTARSRRTRGARARAATYLGQHGRVDSENLRFGEGKGRE